MRLSRREREVLRALVDQTTWPARTTTGWVGRAAQQDWVPDSRKVLARLADLGLAVDEGRSYMTEGARLGKANRYTVTESGREALR